MVNKYLKIYPNNNTDRKQSYLDLKDKIYEKNSLTSRN